MADICVVHLVRFRNGLEPFAKFLRSYASHSAGIDHQLLIIYKGFPSVASASAYEKLLEPFPHKTLFVRDFGFDIRPYFVAVRKFDYKYFMFMNSFSLILEEKWLEKMYKYVSQDDVGLVGATGSLQSMYTDAFNWVITRDIYPFWKFILAKSFRRLRCWILPCFFAPLPNYHIRTNAFMTSREIMLKIRCGLMLNKRNAWMFESGLHGFTRQILNMNLRVLMVGRDGVGYEKEYWHESNIYKQHGQENLLIADNQTITYEIGDNNTRRDESFKAWGDKSDITLTRPEE